MLKSLYHSITHYLLSKGSDVLKKELKPFLEQVLDGSKMTVNGNELHIKAEIEGTVVLDKKFTL